MDKFTEIVIECLHLLKTKENEGLHLNDFPENLDLDISKEKLREFLLKNDFIENDNDPDLYFLTPETFDKIATDDIYELIPTPEEFKIPNKVEPSVKPYNFSIWLNFAIPSIIVSGFIAYGRWLNPNKKVQPAIDHQEIKELADSIKKIKPSNIIYHSKDGQKIK